MIQHINMDPWKQSKDRWQRLRNNSEVSNICRCHMSAQPLLGGKGHLNWYVNTCRHTGIITRRVPTHNIPHICKLSAVCSPCQQLKWQLANVGVCLHVRGVICQISSTREQNQILGPVERSKESRFDWEISEFISIIVDCTNQRYNKGDNGGWIFSTLLFA